MSETLNLRWLANHGASPYVLGVWRERWGDADVSLREVLRALVDHPSGLSRLDWLAEADGTFDRLYKRWWAAIKPAKEKWWAARRLLDKQRRAAEITDAQYLTALKPLDDEYTAACRTELRRLADTMEV